MLGLIRAKYLFFAASLYPESDLNKIAFQLGLPQFQKLDENTVVPIESAWNLYHRAERDHGIERLARFLDSSCLIKSGYVGVFANVPSVNTIHDALALICQRLDAENNLATTRLRYVAGGVWLTRILTGPTPSWKYSPITTLFLLRAVVRGISGYVPQNAKLPGYCQPFAPDLERLIGARITCSGVGVAVLIPEHVLISPPELIPAKSKTVFGDDQFPSTFADSVALVLKAYGFGNWPTLKEFCRLVGISARSLQRGLQDEGTSYGDIISRRRLHAAFGLLRNDDHSVASIASDLGFSNQANFATFFKRYAGTSPSDYRKLLSSKEGFSGFADLTANRVEKLETPIPMS